MIVYKQWKRKNTKYVYGPKDYFAFEGWFLFGIIPLYIRRIGIK